MAKNNQFINAMRNAARYYGSETHIVEMMSAFAIALKRTTNLEQDDITDILVETQNVWDEHARTGNDLVADCLALTNINIMRR